MGEPISNNAVEQTTNAERNACHALCRTERTEQSEFTNEMSNRAHESPQVTNNGKSRATLRRLRSTVLYIFEPDSLKLDSGGFILKTQYKTKSEYLVTLEYDRL